ncbi:MAG: methyltransferase domain-containing protein [Sandaracinaceae bacterium]
MTSPSQKRIEAKGTGSRTLEIFSGTPRLNRWMFSKFERRVRGDVLEIGSGVGNMSALLRERAEHLVVTDVEHEYIEQLRADYATDPRVTVARFDLDAPPPPEVAERSYDAIVAINVIEHVADDVGAMRRLARLLKPSGHLLIYVPALPLIFGSLDDALGHHRRYTKRTLSALARSADLDVVEGPRYMNALGVGGWFVQGRVLRRERLDPAQVALFERLVPLVRLEDHLPLPFGLGVIIHAQARGGASTRR